VIFLPNVAKSFIGTLLSMLWFRYLNFTSQCCLLPTVTFSHAVALSCEKQFIRNLVFKPMITSPLHIAGRFYWVTHRLLLDLSCPNDSSGAKSVFLTLTVGSCIISPGFHNDARWLRQHNVNRSFFSCSQVYLSFRHHI
jgi:hypothetical protein